MFRVEFLNEYTSWLVAHLDFNAIKPEYETREAAQKNIDDYNEYERDSDQNPTDFRVVEC